ncbi:MAG: DDE-type integrase/transposase/recombinase [Kiritimatiellae bacterium]|nr:DDE-type integrase/transposase/recombinase [Verrucomicrobiota bacterium]MCG2661237.1 DDE-type integrase/transposase/recombinase [Kiritimatiellia bacterium]
MNRIVSLVRWFCRQLSLDELFTATAIILEVLNNERPDIKPKDSFRQEHPNYRKFDVDPELPLTECPAPKRSLPSTDWKDLLELYRLNNGKELKPVNRRDQSTSVLNSIRCLNCNAPGKYIYYNDGKKRIQLRCKVCNDLFPIHRHHRPIKAKYWCPLCNNALYLWKKSEILTIYKCPNDNCPRYIAAKNKLNRKEQSLQQQRSSQFKLRYQYREYHFDPRDLVPASPQPSSYGRIDRIHGSFERLGLVLALNISYGLSSRMTAHMLKNIFQNSISHQTVLNYTNAAAVLCHQFNMHHKGPVDSRVAGDETYIRVADRWNYTWFTIGTTCRAIHAYHLSDTRSTQHALITLSETIRTAPKGTTTEFVGDGNPAYDSATHAINHPALLQGATLPLQRRTVIGLTNEDSESTEYRQFKQIIERLNRTYKFHTRARCGFKDFNGAVSLTVLFVTHYNFLRGHSALNYKCPVPLDDLKNIQTIQGRWGKILDMATKLAA